MERSTGGCGRLCRSWELRGDDCWRDASARPGQEGVNVFAVVEVRLSCDIRHLSSSFRPC